MLRDVVGSVLYRLLKLVLSSGCGGVFSSLSIAECVVHMLPCYLFGREDSVVRDVESSVLKILYYYTKPQVQNTLAVAIYPLSERRPDTAPTALLGVELGYTTAVRVLAHLYASYKMLGAPIGVMSMSTFKKMYNPSISLKMLYIATPPETFHTATMLGDKELLILKTLRRVIGGNYTPILLVPLSHTSLRRTVINLALTSVGAYVNELIIEKTIRALAKLYGSHHYLKPRKTLPDIDFLKYVQVNAFKDVEEV